MSQATIRLCLERGWGAVTLDDVAAAADVSVRTFRNYFANKAEAISASHLERMVRIAEDLAARPVTEPLWEAVAAAARAQLAPPDAVAAGPEEERRWRESVRLLMAEPALHGELAKANAAAEDALADAVVQRVGMPASDVYARLVAAVIGAGCAMATERALRADPPRARRVARRGLRAHRGGPPGAAGHHPLVIRKDTQVIHLDVAVVGGGPCGLLLACELAQAGVRPLVLEQLPEPSQESKANGLLGQVVRLMDLRGLHEPMSGRPGPPQPSPGFLFAAMPLGLAALPGNPLYAMPATQLHMTRVLEERALELGVEIRRAHRLTGLAQDDATVAAGVAGPDGAYQLHARYLVGADGAHSATRKLAGIGFPGVTHDDTVQRTAHALVPAEWIDASTGALNVPGHGAVAPFIPCRTEHGTFSYAPLPGQRS